ncbi:uncharacterized protein Dana_GF26633 [Drosophila ananassae]|uniref:Uncharacterized protein n=1 Tax=Drosophila ananassae TaxID=7217 RepID=A0A0P8XIG2_DROAN|nr:uncharacterized protein Dana_GF26633 [Drosophila ananassae]
MSPAVRRCTCVVVVAKKTPGSVRKPPDRLRSARQKPTSSHRSSFDPEVYGGDTAWIIGQGSRKSFPRSAPKRARTRSRLEPRSARSVTGDVCVIGAAEDQERAGTWPPRSVEDITHFPEQTACSFEPTALT